MKPLVVFDLCDTLYAENSTAGFLRFTGHPKTCWPTLPGLDLARRRMIAMLRGARKSELEQWADRYAAEWLPRRENAEVLDRLRAHRDQGDRIAILSAGIDIVVAAVARRLGVDYAASRLAFAGEQCTGRLATDLTGRKLPVALDLAAGARWIAYSDNRSDRALLRAANEAFIVIPRGRATPRWTWPEARLVIL